MDKGMDGKKPAQEAGRGEKPREPAANHTGDALENNKARDGNPPGETESAQANPPDAAETVVGLHNAEGDTEMAVQQAQEESNASLHNVEEPDDPETEPTEMRVGRKRRSIGYLLFAAFLVAAVAAALLLPAFRIYGGSMSPTLEKGETVLAVKGKNWRQGDVIAFEYRSKVLIKRIIAEEGSTVDIGDDGTVFVDGQSLPEPYLEAKAKGACSSALPCTVPEGAYFVLGDSRETAADSRDARIGCVAKEQVIGKIVFRLRGREGPGAVR